MELIFETLNTGMVGVGLLILSLPLLKVIHDVANSDGRDPSGVQQTRELVKVHDDGR
ncbi:hypothetical protein FHS72_001799 [Loktanella ponticola]|uniref:Uncharacterized protein n=1 Tax=Yoonia ponticola TaxID=1524255 RepID=A0A7W9BKK3_9RHOB|nr:hypothetical protein [Yoonia ponticola]MBB5722175.1 hypothetical protein [Yoonia ponticola]